MAVIGARGRVLAELLADHVLGDVDGHVLVAVVDTEGEADELRQDGRPARPDLDDVVAARLARLLGLLQDVGVDERPLPDRTRHDYRPFFRAWRERRISFCDALLVSRVR